VSANLALALAAAGHTVGLLDGDIYGPSQQMMMGTTDDPLGDENGRIQPVEAPGGVKVMSFGFLVDPDQPVIWRGPMLQKALEQFVGDVNWGELDYMVVDLPPGTGDVALTLCQNVPMAGAVIVTTPQDVALIDARKSLHMFRKLGVPVLGIVENMSGYQCPEVRPPRAHLRRRRRPPHRRRARGAPARLGATRPGHRQRRRQRPPGGARAPRLAGRPGFRGAREERGRAGGAAGGRRSSLTPTSVLSF
jgi:hypothetical protein